MNPPPLACQVRDAVDGDAQAIAEVVNRAFTVEEWFVDGDRTTPAEIRRLIAGGQSRFLLAHDGERVIGCVYLEVRADGAGYVGLLAVELAVRG